MHFFQQKPPVAVATAALFFLLLPSALPVTALSPSSPAPACRAADSSLPAPLLRFPSVDAARDSFLRRNPFLRGAYHKDSSGKLVDIFGRRVGC